MIEARLFSKTCLLTFMHVPKVSRLTLEGWLDMCANNVFGSAWYIVWQRLELYVCP